MKKDVSIGSEILDDITEKDIKKIRFMFLQCRVKRLEFDIKQVRTFAELFEHLMKRFIKKLNTLNDAKDYINKDGSLKYKPISIVMNDDSGGLIPIKSIMHLFSIVRVLLFLTTLLEF